MSKTLRFGEIVADYTVPVLNEREIRAAAGMLFLATFLSLLFILFRGNFIPIKFVVSGFLADFLIRVFVSPRFSPTLVAGRLIVASQNPEYVAAKPKRLAWLIGIGLSATMFILMVIMNTFSPITGVICLICLVFLFFESAFGICLGCKLYRLVYREQPTLCPGEVCAVHARQEIQRTSAGQWLALLAFAALLVAASIALTRTFAIRPHPLFGGATTAKGAPVQRAQRGALASPAGERRGPASGAPLRAALARQERASSSAVGPRVVRSICPMAPELPCADVFTCETSAPSAGPATGGDPK